MDELKWELLTEVQGRWRADLLKSYFEAAGIELELFQEALGYQLFPTDLDVFGLVQIFVSRSQFKVAQKLLDEYNNSME